MLTHHQYTNFQKCQNYTVDSSPSDTKKSGSNRTSAESERQEKRNMIPPLDVHAPGEFHLIGSACCLIGSDKPCFRKVKEKRFSASIFSQDIHDNHFESNLLFRVTDGQFSFLIPVNRISAKSYIAQNVAQTAPRGEPHQFQLLRSTKERSQSTADKLLPKNSTNISEGGSSIAFIDPGLRKTNLQNYIKTIEHSCEYMSILQRLTTIDWSRVEKSEFVGLVTQDIYFTTAFQTYLQQTELTSQLERQILPAVEELAVDKYGCHILRIVVKKSAAILQACATSLLKSFKKSCAHEFMNKVMQAVATEDQRFRIGCLVNLKKYWNELKLSVSSIYLLAACLRNTPSWDHHFQAIGNMLLKKSGNLLKDKNDKRMLARYLEFCDTAEVEEFYQAMDFEKEFHRRFDDKYMVYIFRLLLRRGHESSICLLQEILCLELESALDAGPFRQLLREIIIESEKWAHLSDQLFAQLRQIKFVCSWNRSRIDTRPKQSNHEDL